MCGIAGIVSLDEQHSCSDSLRAMTDAIKHRGPDDAGFYESQTREGKYIGLGHRRLSIIDLESGKQPITNENETVFLVFNGEIYNFQVLRAALIEKGHVFRTRSDSEVIVHAYEEYGEECVKHLDGMFAFAIWDSRKQVILLARDRFGKKPLFYVDQNHSLFFASEIKSFFAFPDLCGGINEDVLRDYLVYRYVPGPDTLYKQVRKLEPGTTATYEKGKLSHQCYYTPCDRTPLIKRSTVFDPTAEFLRILRTSVELRMVSDVPFGAFLSGGMDSSVVVGLMTEFSQLPIKTFSVGFAETAYSELKYAGEIARHFKTEHHELVVSHEEIIDYLPELVRFRDAPVSEPSDIPIYLLSREARKTVKMVLTGEGSDEILGGYPKHLFERYSSIYQGIPRVVRRRIIEPMVNGLPYSFRRAKTAINTMGIEDAIERLPRWFGAIGYRDSHELLQLPGRGVAPPGQEARFSVDPRASALRKILYFDQTSWLPDNLLERGDRMTMAASIEARMPFMDHHLADYISGLPDKYRIRGRCTKWILRDAVKQLIPRRIVERPKVGFRLPVNEWFRGPLRDYLYSHLMEPDSQSNRYYRKDALARILGEHSSGRQNHEKLLWTMLNLEIWLRINADQL